MAEEPIEIKKRVTALFQVLPASAPYTECQPETPFGVSVTAFY
jgi:hypothetical protein